MGTYGLTSIRFASIPGLSGRMQRNSNFPAGMDILGAVAIKFLVVRRVVIEERVRRRVFINYSRRKKKKKRQLNLFQSSPPLSRRYAPSARVRGRAPIVGYIFHVI